MNKGNIAIVIALIAILLAGLHLVFDKDVVPSDEYVRVGATGDTNLTNLVLSGDLTVGDDTTMTDALTVAGTLTADGDVIVDDVTYRGGVLASKSEDADTLLASTVCDYDTYNAGLNAAFTLTLPTSASLGSDCLTTVGDSQELLIYNAASASDYILTLSAGTGTEFVLASAGGSQDTEITLARRDFALLKFVKMSVASICIFAHEYYEF